MKIRRLFYLLVTGKFRQRQYDRETALPCNVNARCTVTTPVPMTYIQNKISTMKRMMVLQVLLFVLIAGLFNSSPVLALDQALLIVELESGTVIVEQGDTQSAYPPCSTFKIPLALMGFDLGILKSPTEPVWIYEKDYAGHTDEGGESAMASPGASPSSARKPTMGNHDSIKATLPKFWQRPTQPTHWLAESVVWYSQVLTRRMGEETFKRYVDSFRYGNGDISGDPGKNNGLTNCWLSSSLHISPSGQTTLLRDMLLYKLPVSDRAVVMTKAAMPVFSTPGGWTIYGKTGSGTTRTIENPASGMGVGWFVGWGIKNERILVFACLLKNGGTGMKAREVLLEEWDACATP